MPWDKKSEDKLDLKQAKKMLDKHHYGMDKVKEKIIEYLAVLSLTRGKQEVSRAPILCLVGLVGTGKTTFGPSLSEAMERSYVRNT